MTIKIRLRKLEQRADQHALSAEKMPCFEWLRTERIRLLNDPDYIERRRQEAMRRDALRDGQPRRELSPSQ